MTEERFIELMIGACEARLNSLDRVIAEVEKQGKTANATMYTLRGMMAKELAYWKSL